jgi:tetratricopeptide (TPR) repeat protein
LTYSLDPIPTFTSNNQVADYIQFPLQTLQYRGGKCSDFSVLYASLFEALGIETAFITIPGHIYVAVALQMGPDDARKFFQHPDDLIFQNDKAWVPIEITLREGGFMKAWELGAKEWRENQAKNTARFYSIPESWKVYQPVGYSGTTADIKIPSDTKIVAAYTKEVQSFVDSEMGEQEAILKADIDKSDNKPKAMNNLAVLYGRFGMYAKSQKVLQDIIANTEYVPALVNLGNIYFVKGDMDSALQYYQRAYKKAPTNATVLLCVARASHAEENYATAKKAYEELKLQDPALAQRFAYLDLRGEEATRAADAAQLTGVVIWQQ